jgi:hypothetical protein
MAINLCAYKKPSTPSAISPFPSPDSAVRLANFLAGVRSICGYTRTIPTPTVSQAPPLLAYSLYPALAHLLMPSVHFLSQETKRVS